jgi:SAM-dependent methyltransferase
VKRVFEPACGTGRLLVKLAAAGYKVAGNDINPKAVAFCNARLKRHGFPLTTVVGDMSDFKLPRPADAAFNMINSFRHLSTEAAARDHLRCMAAALMPGGIYLLGLHLTPKGQAECDQESWSARRGYLAVISQMQSLEVDRRKRLERVAVTFDVYTPTRQFRLAEEMAFRTYTASQFRRLLADVPELELVETYDFSYDIDNPLPVNDASEDVVFVLRARAKS